VGTNFKFDTSKLKKVIGEQVAKAEIAVPCPECGIKNRVRGKDIAREGTFVCTGCRKRVKMHDKGDGFSRIIQGR
jgi:hypothetical protein